MELTVIATISTAHVDRESADILNKRFEENRPVDDENHWSNHLQWGNFPYGWVLVISGSVFDGKEPKDVECGIPESIMAAALLARKRGAKWLCFDCDAPESAGLKVYE